MSRLTVLHAAKFYPPVRGGMETVVGDLCNGTAEEWDVRVVAANDRPRTVEERCGDVEVVRAAALGSANSVPLCPSLAMHLWRKPADCVVLHEPNPIAGSALFLRMPGRRLVVWHHSDLLRPWWAPYTYGLVQRALYRRAECVIVSSPNLAASSSLVQCARRVVVIPFGIQIERYRSLDGKQRAIVSALRTTTAGPRALFVGRFVYYKGVDVLLEAMARCAGTLLLVGDGPLEPALRQRAIALGIQDRVVFAGRVSDEDLPAYYQASDVFVLPSIARTETFGVVQVEAMAAGLPVVSTNLPTGVPWVNQHGVSGLVVPPADAGRLADAIGCLLENPELRERLGRNAAARASDLFSRDRMIAAFRDVVDRAVGAPDLIGSRVAHADVS
jgi:glycosyltransferase involved in cell wall biosynthesis